MSTLLSPKKFEVPFEERIFFSNLMLVFKSLIKQLVFMYRMHKEQQLKEFA